MIDGVLFDVVECMWICQKKKKEILKAKTNGVNEVLNQDGHKSTSMRKTKSENINFPTNSWEVR